MGGRLYALVSELQPAMAAKITGFTSEETIGKGLVENYIRSDYQESVRKVLQDAMLGKETSNYESFISKDYP